MEVLTAMWKFRSMSPSEMIQDPFQEEFFVANDLDSKVNSLVRETIQNSLDAAIGSNEVIVRFYLNTCGSDQRSITNNSVYGGLEMHLQVNDNGISVNDYNYARSNGDYLLIEDYNTTGLDGDVNNYLITNNIVERNDFFWFWRNVGRSGKSGSERGKWGLGKTIFPASSRIRTFFGFTIRNSEPRHCLMGLSVLKTHYLENTSKSPYGYYGCYNNDEDEYFATPLTNSNDIEHFKTTYNLGRSNEKGLSVVIPFPSKDITFDSILKCVIKQYYYSILKRNLVVILEEESDTDHRLITINESYLESDLDLDDTNDPRVTYKDIIHFAKETIIYDDTNKVLLQDQNNLPQWRRDRFVLIDSNLKERFNGGNIIAFRIPLMISLYDQQKIDSYFELFLQKVDQHCEPQTNFIRDGITILGENSKYSRTNIRSIVLIEEENLSQLLGNAENPAHTEWQNDSLNFRGKYDNGSDVISFVRKSVSKLYKKLLESDSQIDDSFFIDYFFVQENNQSNVETTDEIRGLTLTPSDLDLEEQRLSQCRIARVSDGVIITMNEEYMLQNNSYMKICLAYNIESGDPLRKYSEFDFSLNTNDNLEIDNCTVLHCANNIIKFSPLGNDSKLKIKGLDSKRDLYIRLEVCNDTEI